MLQLVWENMVTQMNIGARKGDFGPNLSAKCYLRGSRSTSLTKGYKLTRKIGSVGGQIKAKLNLPYR